jgi:hypothetical protein
MKDCFVISKWKQHRHATHQQTLGMRELLLMKDSIEAFDGITHKVSQTHKLVPEGELYCIFTPTEVPNFGYAFV